MVVTKRKQTPEVIRLRRKLEKWQCILLAGVLIPGYYVVQIFVVKTCLLHYILSVYGFTNIVGNMYLSIFTDTRVRSYTGDGKYCEICKQNQPPMSWHCPTCDACMKRSDHHCYFLSHCVGRNNYRYFVCFLGHWTLVMLYCSVWYAFQVKQINFDAFLSPVRLLHPFYPPTVEDFYVGCLFLDLCLLLLASGLFGFHIRNVYRGTTSYQSWKHKPYIKSHWKTNVVYFFGTRWYWAILWPFVDSPFPDYELLNTLE
ncbi:probable palmitoyltransferase ZDHHC24 [Choristoneura fumiferana]|uniref:probable palmitoyltransferase ZDHHC24 n=1 Tax=Choristoneura fumiferana TaxID=7141 RepID=UPI003D15367F